MAKMTVQGITYEGTPEELRAIIATFEEAEEPAQAEPADKLTHKGTDYTLVQRKAQPGDVAVIPKGGGSPYFDEGKSYAVSGKLYADVATAIGENGESFVLYNGKYNRTESNVLVYEKVEADVPDKYPQNGDIVRVIIGCRSIKAGDIGEVVGADNTDMPRVKVGTDAHYVKVEIVARAADRVDTK